MAKFELKLPKMGESVAEATITNWLKKVGDKIEVDEAILEIATDKVDSEVPSEVAGTLSQILFNVDDVVQVGQTIALIDTEGGSSEPTTVPEVEVTPEVAAIEQSVEIAKETVKTPVPVVQDFSNSERFYSPLVKNIAKSEGVSVDELDKIPGTGKEGRVTKDDILSFLQNRGKEAAAPPVNVAPPTPLETTKAPEVKKEEPILVNTPEKKIPVSVNGQDEIIEMDRMRKLISNYMTESKRTSAHVQSFIEVDVTNIVNWRNKVKDAFEKREGEKLTFTPIFMEA
ncbi:MAG: biotin/lipoyl-containing protein, partial [Flavobacterium sp.]